MSKLLLKPGHLIRRCQQIAVAIFIEECSAHGVTPVQYAILEALREYGRLGQISLANAVALDRSTVGELVSRLESRGWISRSPSAQDRRAKELKLTRTGARMLAQLEPLVERAQRKILAPLSAGEREQFLTCLGKLAVSSNELSRAPLRSVARSA
ncbi:MAG: MarR family winged helix-turn-helix transcriptional regulator [Steroidobacteraceae bacterium]